MLLSLAAFSGAATAACLPGLPCVTTAATGDTCDADFMNQIYARSFIEGQREMVMNQVLIRKPDSVLEYTCFDQFVRDSAEIAGPIFSEIPDFTGITVPNPGAADIEYTVNMTDTKLDSSLNALVMASLNAYTSTNFAHDLLGGTSGEANTIASSVSGADNACSFMNDIYFFARCKNFATDDQFFKFDDLVSSDPRNLIPDLRCSTGSGITQGHVDTARDTVADTPNIFMDFVDASSCEPPIPTGVTAFQTKYAIDLQGNVNKVDDFSFPDHVCANPGCYFDRASGNCRLTP